MHCIIDTSEFLRTFKIAPNATYKFFLGAGASKSSGCPLASELIFNFKKEILISQGKVKSYQVENLSMQSVKFLIESHFNKKDEDLIDNLYSYYFEKAYPQQSSREDFISKILKDKSPSIGYICLASLIKSSYIKDIWTTNFDDLIEKATAKLDKSITTISTKDFNIHNKAQIRDDIPKVIKLHGDFRYDKLRNTNSELVKLDEVIYNAFIDSSKKGGLIVIGYSGKDVSIMDVLREALNDNRAFPRGLIWCLLEDEEPSEEVKELVNKAHKNNNASGFVYINSFDAFLYKLYNQIGIKDEYVDSLLTINQDEKKEFKLNGKYLYNKPLLINAIKVKTYPKYIYEMETKIKDWDELKKITNNYNVVGALHKGKTYFLGEKNHIEKINEKYSSKSIKRKFVEPKNFSYPSFYISLLYSLINKSLVLNYNFVHDNKKYIKFFSKKYKLSNEEKNKINKFNKNFDIQSDICVFEAFKYSLRFIYDDLFFIIKPCVHIVSKNDSKINYKKCKYMENIIYSYRYNDIYGQKLRNWIKSLSKNYSKEIKFSLGEDKIELFPFYSSVSLPNNTVSYNFEQQIKIPEPFLFFHHSDKSKKTIHPLVGLKKMGTLENSYSQYNNKFFADINIGILSLKSDFDKIKSHLNNLNKKFKTTNEKDYIIDYPGFKNILKKNLVIPDSNTEGVVLISESEIKNLNVNQFYNLIKNKIISFLEQPFKYDCIIFYISKKLIPFKNELFGNFYFDLHDSLKIFCANKNIKIQIIEEKSIDYRNKAKIMWWLSLAIYVKANGIPWRIVEKEDNTAYVGISYAMYKNSNKKHIVTSNCQIFDGNDNGFKFLLKPINNPLIIKNNPYMSKEDAFKLIDSLKNIYYDNISKFPCLKRIVIHKTTPFVNEEIEGVKKALTNLDNIELIQIQQLNPWVAIKLYKESNKQNHSYYNFPIERGTVILLDKYRFLIWTHGAVIGNGLNNNCYYKGKRGIPKPLLITRFLGKDPIEKVAEDIMKFTKMNWNGGDLYSNIPVTIDYSQRLSRIGKQLEELDERAFDFRFFI